MNKILFYLLTGFFSFTLILACNDTAEKEPTGEETNTQPVPAEKPTDPPAENKTDEQTETSTDEQSEILGTWYTEETISGEELTFREDGTYSAASRGEAVTGKWETANGKIKMGDDLSSVQALPYGVENGKLIIGELTYEPVKQD